MRFPRLHFGAIIAMGSTMLCMSMVPVFADGLVPPTLTASVSNATVTLSWNVPGGTNHFVLRRSTSAAPSNMSEGTMILTTADNTTTSYEDVLLESGTYYYSIFGRSSGGGLTSGAGSADPLTVTVVAASSEAPVSHSGGGKRGKPGSGGGQAPTLAELRVLREQATTHAAAPESDMQTRVCDRVMSWFSTDEKMLGRVNERLMKRFGFVCEK
ncbi:immunoglobulin domain-containing protein [Candidatus Peribacteria bacterium]|nr:MAG: immunoglobulin domain-containing protein [Candidatus Peribacteria bacterium]